MFPFIGGGGRGGWRWRRPLILTVTCVGRLWGQHVHPAPPPRAESVNLCEFDMSDLFFSFALVSRRKKAAKKPIEMPGLSLAKLAILNELLWKLSSAPNHVSGSPNELCQSHSWMQRSRYERGGKQGCSFICFPPPPFLKSGTVNQSQVSTRRIRSARVSLIGLMGFTPDCLLFSIKRPTAGGITAGVIHSYCWQSRRAPNTRQLFQITVKISVSQ